MQENPIEERVRREAIHEAAFTATFADAKKPLTFWRGVRWTLWFVFVIIVGMLSAYWVIVPAGR